VPITAAPRDMLIMGRRAGTTRPRASDITLRPAIMVRHRAIILRDPNIMGRRPATKRIKRSAGIKNPASAAPRSSGGRPSREAAALLRDKILDVATEQFLRDGYGAVSIEMIARDARVSKRTFYQRFSNKAGLFKDVVHRIVERLRPENDAGLFEGDDLERILLRLARIILDATLTPSALALYRITVAEATRFPELAMVVSQQTASREAIRRIGALLEREALAGRLSVSDFAFAAAQFLYMVVSLPQRRALGMGTPMTARERDAWIRNTVNLFLNGCRGGEPG
jgi:TetR/AcrR family transcriptional regulator, mexJK operon transcriptional repressor